MKMRYFYISYGKIFDVSRPYYDYSPMNYQPLNAGIKTWPFLLSCVVSAVFSSVEVLNAETYKNWWISENIKI
jgi:hypothetical protein